MAKQKKVTTPPVTSNPVTESTAPKPIATVRSSPRAKPMVNNTHRFLFDKTNYKWMIGGVVLIILGFILMSGGKSADPKQFNYDEIYSFRRVTLAPLVVLLGFAVEFYAIMRKPSVLKTD